MGGKGKLIFAQLPPMDWTQNQHQHHRLVSQPAPSRHAHPRPQPPPQPAAARPYSQHVASGSYQQTRGHGWSPREGGDPTAAGGQPCQQRHPAVNMNMNLGHDSAVAAAAAVNLNHCPPAPRVGHQHHRYASQQHAPHPYRVGGETPGTGSWQQQTGRGAMGGGGAGSGTAKPATPVWISGGGGRTGAAAAVGHPYHPASSRQVWARARTLVRGGEMRGMQIERYCCKVLHFYSRSGE